MKLLTIIGGAAIGVWLLSVAAKASPGLPNIAATNMTLDKTGCQGQCVVNGSITWKNTGDVADSYLPSISKNGTVQSIAATKTLQPEEEYTIKFTIPISNTTEFCPVPN